MSGINVALAIGLAAALAGVVLLVVVVLLLVRSRGRAAARANAAPASAPKPKPLRSIYSAFERGLPRSGRGAPVVLVLGERLSGKSSLIAASFARGGADATVVPHSSSDPRISLYGGRGLIIAELGAELLEDGRAETRKDVEKLLRSLALRVVLVVLAVDASAPSYSAPGLRRLGARARELLDVLTAARRRPPRARVCLTHLDERVEGFLEIADMAAAAGFADTCLTLRGRRASDLDALLGPVAAHLPASLGNRSLDTIGRMARTLSGGANQLFGMLEHCLVPLLGTPRPAPAPWLDGLVLAGLAPDRTEAMLGDPLHVEAAHAAADLNAHERRRFWRALTYAGVISAVLVGMYALHLRDLEAVPGAVDEFVDAGTRKTTADDLAEAEDRAASTLRRALSPLWPPLRSAFPWRTRADLVERDRFVQALRRHYLCPKTSARSAETRLHAATLLRAYQSSRLGRLVLRRKSEFAAALGMPEHAIEDYVRFTPGMWSGAVGGLPPPSASTACGTLLDPRAPIASELPGVSPDAPEATEALGEPDAARPLAVAAGVIDEPSDRDIWEQLALESPKDAAQFRFRPRTPQAPDAGRRDGARPEPPAVVTPSAAGKSLRQMVEDLTTMPCPRHDGGAADPDTDPSALVASTRSSRYVTSFVNSARKREPRYLAFFADQAFSPVGASDRPGRGATRTLAGEFTAHAVDEQLVPALSGLDAALDGACVSQSARMQLSQLVRTAMESYAAAYQKELTSYLNSFVFPSESVADLQQDLRDLVSASSWFGAFWRTMTTNASVNAHGDPYLGILEEALAMFAPIAALAPEKGGVPKLDKYYAIIEPLALKLEEAPLGPAESPLEDRLSPLGKLGLSLVNSTSDGPRSAVQKWLAAAKITQDEMRRPFLEPVSRVYEKALGDLDSSVAVAYQRDIRPIVEPLWRQFPFAPDAVREADPADVGATLGPKGTLRVAFEQTIGPVVVKRRDGSYARKSVPEYRAENRVVAVPEEALVLGKWSDGVDALLFDQDGKPKPMSLLVQPTPLAQFSSRDTKAFSKSYLVVGDARIEGFNQVPSWKPLAVNWVMYPPSLVGVDVTDPKTGSSRPSTVPGQGEAWQFLRLICQAARWQGDTVEWDLEDTVAFRVKADPWDKLLAPGAKHRCPARRRADSLHPSRAARAIPQSDTPRGGPAQP